MIRRPAIAERCRTLRVRHPYGAKPHTMTETILPALVLLLPRLQVVDVQLGARTSCADLLAVLEERSNPKLLALDTMMEEWRQSDLYSFPCSAVSVLRSVSRMSLDRLALHNFVRDDELPANMPSIPTVTRLDFQAFVVPDVDVLVEVLKLFPQLRALDLDLDIRDWALEDAGTLIESGALDGLEDLRLALVSEHPRCDRSIGAHAGLGRLHKLVRLTWATWPSDPTACGWGQPRMPAVEHLAITDDFEIAPQHVLHFLSLYPALRELHLSPSQANRAATIKTFEVRSAVPNVLTAHSQPASISGSASSCTTRV